MTRAPLVVALCLTLLTQGPAAQLEPFSEPDSLGPLGGSAISVVPNPADPAEILVVQYTKGLGAGTSKVRPTEPSAEPMTAEPSEQNATSRPNSIESLPPSGGENVASRSPERPS